MTSVNTKSVTAAPSGTSVKVEIAAADTARAIMAAAHGHGEGVRVTIACSGTNHIVADDGQFDASATQLFQVDAGFAPWVEAKVQGPGASYDLVLSVAAV